MRNTAVDAPGFPVEQVRERARHGTAAVFPPTGEYGVRMFGGTDDTPPADGLDALRIVPPVFMPMRLEKLIELGREPTHDDVDLSARIGGFFSHLPVFLSAFGSTRLGSRELGIAASAQAGRLGIPMVIGENVVPVHGYHGPNSPILQRIEAYLREVPDGVGGVVVQQSTEDADAEVWNLVYSSPAAGPLLGTGRLAFELKIGQGAKPGLGGMTVLDRREADRLADRFTVHDVLGNDTRLRCATPGTFTEEIMRQQLRFMRNNFPRAKVWVKLHPGRDIAHAAATAWRAGADAVTVDGAEGGTGWAPVAFPRHVGLPLAECLRRIGQPEGCLLVSGRMWEGTRVVRSIALGANAAGLGRAALLAVAEDAEHGLIRLVAALALEAQLLISALGKYTPLSLNRDDVWAGDDVTTAQPAGRR